MSEGAKDLHSHDTIRASGTCASKYERVLAAFEKNFNTVSVEGYRDLGASLCVMVEGETVVDLWGGHIDRQRSEPWKEDTMVCVFSVTKAVASICMHMLHERGVIDVDAPIAHYWPEFGGQGKSGITVRQVLSHQAGLMFSDAAADGKLWCHREMTGALEAKSPEWIPGTDGGYHSFTFGPILQEIVQRSTGKTLGHFLRHEVGAPLGIEFGFGLSDEENDRCSPFFVNEMNGTISAFRHDTRSSVYRCWKALPRDESFNSKNWRKLEFASLNGHGNARAIAKLFACLAGDGEVSGVRLLSPARVRNLSSQHWQGMDRFSESHARYNAGFQLSNEVYPFGGHPGSFGFYGIGGSVGFCDPASHLAFAYCGNNCISGASAASSLSSTIIDTVYRLL